MNEQVKIKNSIFLDLEADNATKGNKTESFLLQISAIKIDKNNKEEIFNEICFRKEISSRISNLLKKDINFYNNNDFKDEIENYQKFYEFCQGYNVYAFGNYDNLIFKHLIKRNNKLKLPKIKIKDIQKNITKKLKLNLNTGLGDIALILNIDFNKNHDPIEDANALYRICSIIFNENFNINKYKEAIDNINFLPIKTSSEYAKFNENNNNNNELDKNFGIVLIDKSCKNIKVKSFEINDDVFISSKLEELVKKDSYIQSNEFKIYEISNENKIIKMYEYNVDSKIEWHNKKEIKELVKRNKRNLFISNSKSTINTFSEIGNSQLFYMSCKSIKYKIDEKNIFNDLNRIKKNIQKSMDFYHRFSK